MFKNAVNRILLGLLSTFLIATISYGSNIKIAHDVRVRIEQDTDDQLIHHHPAWNPNSRCKERTNLSYVREMLLSSATTVFKCVTIRKISKYACKKITSIVLVNAEINKHCSFVCDPDSGEGFNQLLSILSHTKVAEIDSYFEVSKELEQIQIEVRINPILPQGRSAIALFEIGLPD